MRSAPQAVWPLPAPALVLALALALPLAAAAGDGERWDDHHMRSNFAHRLGPPPPRPPIQGVDRYHQVVSEPEPTPPTAVPEAVLQLSPHGWKPGGPTATASSSSRRRGSGHGALGSARPSTSSGLRATGTQSPRSSSLRSSATSQRRTRR